MCPSFYLVFGEISLKWGNFGDQLPRLWLGAEVAPFPIVALAFSNPSVHSSFNEDDCDLQISLPEEVSFISIQKHQVSSLFTQTTMVLCSFCSSIPLKLFSTARNTQCTIQHHNSFQDLQESGAAGCEVCNLLLNSIQKQTDDGENDRVFGGWPKDGSVTVCSTKFDKQLINIGHKQAGSFRGNNIPTGWRMNSSPETEVDEADLPRRPGSIQL